MNVKELLNRLSDSYPEYADFGYDSLFLTISNKNTIITKISYGKNSVPIISIDSSLKSHLGFRFFIDTANATETIAVIYGPKVRELLLKKFSEYPIVLDE